MDLHFVSLYLPLILPFLLCFERTLAFKNETTAPELTCSGQPFKMCGTIFSKEMLFLFLYSPPTKEHVMYAMKADSVRQNLEFGALYLKKSPRATMMEVFSWDPAVNVSDIDNQTAVIKNIRMMDIESNTDEGRNNFSRMLVFFYDDPTRIDTIMIKFDFNKTDLNFLDENDKIEVEYEFTSERVNLTDGTDEHTHQSLVMDPDSKGLQFVYHSNLDLWTVNDVEQVYGTIYPTKPLHDVSIFIEESHEYLFLIQHDVKPPKEYAQHVKWKNVIGFIEPNTRATVLFADNQVLFFTDHFYGQRHISNYAYNLTHLPIHKFFSCNGQTLYYRPQNYENPLAAARVSMIFAFFIGIMLMGVLALLHTGFRYTMEAYKRSQITSSLTESRKKSKKSKISKKTRKTRSRRKVRTPSRSSAKTTIKTKSVLSQANKKKNAKVSTKARGTRTTSPGTTSPKRLGSKISTIGSKLNNRSVVSVEQTRQGSTISATGSVMASSLPGLAKKSNKEKP